MKKNILRLSKLMSQRKICSRREAEDYIEKKLVKVDGKIVDKQGIKVSEDADIELLDEAKKIKKSKVTILLNKPIGYVSTQPEKNYRPAIDLITKGNQIMKNGELSFNRSFLKKLSVVGRLDINSKGLLVFTQDGVLAKQIIGSESKVEKEYLVYVEGSVTEEKINKLRFGLYLDNKKLKKAKIDLLKPHFLRFILQEGKKRQIRRMCEMVDLNVVGLKRVRIGNIRLKDLPEGKWRLLSSDESFI